MPDTDIEPVYSLGEVAAILSRGGLAIKERSIRTEIENGKLVATKVAGKMGVMKSDLEAYLRAARQCREKPAQPDSSSSESATGQKPAGSSAGTRAAGSASSPRARAKSIAAKLKQSSGTGSPAGPDAATAQVILLR